MRHCPTGGGEQTASGVIGFGRGTGIMDNSNIVRIVRRAAAAVCIDKSRPRERCETASVLSVSAPWARIIAQHSR